MKMYNKKKAKDRYKTISFSDKKQSIIALSVDVRNSTKMKKDIGSEKTVEILKPFIEECFILMKKRNCFYNFIYAGDGIIAICNVNNDENNFANVYHCAKDINSFLKDFKIWVKNMYGFGFNAGIGIAWDDKTYIESIKNLPTKMNNILYTGDSISVASKLSGKRDKQLEKYGIAITKKFYNKLRKKDTVDFKIKTEEICYTNVSWEE
ncbi:hypothetical protein [Mesoplasma seiffertii]|uniref:hypothetical protein n=1 Tax=Mesoplasma seiffertii TaxID=28224 RepID=UPI00047E8CC3|nr:hypothetical protein [Mesoplasma seiffertii]